LEPFSHFTKTGSGQTCHRKSWEEKGPRFLQARILLMLALTKTTDPLAVGAYFNAY
jgi:hypothetical protein